MSQLIVYQNENGFCSIVIPTEEALQVMSLNEIAIKSGAPVNYQLIDSESFPTDRYFRNAWVLNEVNNSVNIDMPKAREIHMDRLRLLRQEKFEQLGFAVQTNPDLEALLPQALQDILQSLRDIPQTYDLSVATTPNELKNMIPAILMLQ